MTPLLMLVEDDFTLGSNVKDRLDQEGFETVWVTTVTEAKELFLKRHFDLLILDIGLPDGTGLELAKEIKQQSDVPVLFLTAWNTAENRLEGYELGAEEFIPKPFHFRELLIRVQHVLKTHVRLNTLSLPKGLLDLEKMTFTNQIGGVSFFGQRDFEVLRLLLDSAPRPVSRDEILDKIWGQESFPTHRTVDNSIVRLREILNDEEGDIIRSVRGVGYQWVHK